MFVFSVYDCTSLLTGSVKGTLVVLSLWRERKRDVGPHNGICGLQGPQYCGLC